MIQSQRTFVRLNAVWANRARQGAPEGLTRPGEHHRHAGSGAIELFKLQVANCPRVHVASAPITGGQPITGEQRGRTNSSAPTGKRRTKPITSSGPGCPQLTQLSSRNPSDGGGGSKNSPMTEHIFTQCSSAGQVRFFATTPPMAILPPTFEDK
uniref:Uncharacterized protein n=1 Tax=Trichuris muris TaxID=70415 RepID=A0A5S6QP67_TRIMR